MYVVKMDGEKVRVFDNRLMAYAWARKHCSSEWSVVSLVDCGRLPDAARRRYPNENLDSFVYKPYTSLN